MNILVIDEDSKTMWLRPFCNRQMIHQLKLLIKTYNDLKDLYYDIQVCKDIPPLFFDENYKIVTMTNFILDDMKRELLTKKII